MERKILSESKLEICKMPGCDKEPFDKRALFCGEHEREFKNFLSYAGKVGPVAVSAALFVAKVVGRKKK